MKKLLLVLMVVALSSFLLVGCLGEGTVVDPDPDPDPDPTPAKEVTIAVTNEYTDAGGTTYVPSYPLLAEDEDVDVTVTFTEAVETDYIVYIAQKVETAGVITYENKMVATPNTARTIWTVEDVDFLGDMGATECTSFCLVALVKHPCCPGEEVQLKVVSVDTIVPYADLFVTVEDCADECDPDPCATDGVYLTWTSTTAATSCLPADDCCGDACSGLASWTIEVEPDACEGPCDLVTGSCPVVGTLDCGCLPYADSGATVTYTVSYTLLDNVGNEFTEDWTIELGEDSSADISVTGTIFADQTDVDLGEQYQVYDGDC